MTIKAGPCGAARGELKDMENTDDITSIDKIRVNYSNCINAITIYYTVDGVQQPPVTWGEPGHHESKEFTLQAHEYITNVKGTYGTSDDDDDKHWCGLRALKFETNKNSRGPFGNYSVGTRFELPAVNGKIIGFHGRARTRLDALGVHIKVDDVDGP